MNLRPLIIDTAVRERVRLLRAHAELPENIYKVGSPCVPGNDPRHTLWIKVGYRCVYSVTLGPEGNKRYRQLSISVNQIGKLPNVPAVLMIADLFGFTGWDAAEPSSIPKDWIIGPHTFDPCVVVAQEIGIPILTS